MKQSFPLLTSVPNLEAEQLEEIADMEAATPHDSMKRLGQFKPNSECKLGIAAIAPILFIFLFRTTYVSFCLLAGLFLLTRKVLEP